MIGHIAGPVAIPMKRRMIAFDGIAHMQPTSQ
jgi:hypothetical protein